MPRVALAIFIVALWIYGLIDCARTPRASMPGRLPKWVWMLLALVPVLGSLLWLGLSWWAKHPEGLSGTLSLGRRSGPQASEPAPVAPGRTEADGPAAGNGDRDTGNSDPSNGTPSSNGTSNRP